MRDCLPIWVRQQELSAQHCSLLLHWYDQGEVHNNLWHPEAQACLLIPVCSSEPHSVILLWEYMLKFLLLYPSISEKTLQIFVCKRLSNKMQCGKSILTQILEYEFSVILRKKTKNMKQACPWELCIVWTSLGMFYENMELYHIYQTLAVVLKCIVQTHCTYRLLSLQDNMRSVYILSY